MTTNSFGHHFVMSSFGESHGPAMGVVVDGCPAGVEFDFELLTKSLERRRPGHSPTGVTSSRREPDEPTVLSGVFEGKTLGTPIAIVVKNLDARSQNYESIRNSPRVGHADDTWKDKFGHVDFRGGGRASGRETISRVMAGAVAQMFVRQVCPEARVLAFANTLGPFHLQDEDRNVLQESWLGDENCVEKFSTRFPSAALESQVAEFLQEAKSSGQSHGGIAEIWLQGFPSGLGQPVFHKLKTDLTAAMMSIGATAGVEVGEGFQGVCAKGTEFHGGPQSVYGGIRGGISTGEKVTLKVAVKPPASIMDTAKKGRHDPCLLPRIVPVMESMAWLVLADHILWKRTDQV